ncbi:MAG: type IV pilus assembly protein PilM [Candidatus Moraniibacteriota bacterium]|nr:MAG: type IV pilus assembly protein PilM [Candidatus Moranbacteria bacterium]
MELFSKFFRKNVFLGIDVGTSSIKAVEVLFEGQKVQLLNYGSILIRDPSLDTGDSPTVDVAIRALLREMKIKANRLYISLPGSNGLVALLEFPEMSEKDLEKAVQFEASKYVPTDMEDVALSWEVVRKSESQKERIIPESSLEKEKKEKSSKKDTQEVLLVAALKNDVAMMSSYFKRAQYQIHAIELESFSLVRSLAGGMEGDVLVIDIGYNSCNLVLARDGVVRISRTIDAGGKGITETIADGMNISKSRADGIKKENEDLFKKKGMPMTFSSLEIILNEAQRIITSYEKKHAHRKINKIILSGGTSLMRGIEDFFKEKTGRQVFVGNPWKNIEYNPQLEPYMEEMGGSFSVAVGLALRGVEDYRRGI